MAATTLRFQKLMGRIKGEMVCSGRPLLVTGARLRLDGGDSVDQLGDTENASDSSHGCNFPTL